jgi:hypothetical protein
VAHQLLGIGQRKWSARAADPVRAKTMSKGKVNRVKNLPISTALRDTISERGLTAYAAAKQSGVSVDAIQRFLNEERGLTLATVDKLADALGLTLCADDPQSNGH